MPLETLVGPNLAALLKRAQTVVGPDAVIVHTRRVRTADGSAFEVVAADPDTAARHAREQTNRPTAGHESFSPKQPLTGALVIAFVGPTGAGKTSTIAKLASHARVFGGRRVGLVTLDTYRVGAVEELRTHAAIARVPCEVVYGGGDVDGIRARFYERDVWLIDTPGRSPSNRRDREAIAFLLAALRPTEVHLVLPATWPPHLVGGLLRDSAGFGVTHLLATKVDEAPDEASVFQEAARRGLPMRWTTAGQSVPLDLGSASDALEASRLTNVGSAAGVLA